jgi:hypothetical protein
MAAPALRLMNDLLPQFFECSLVSVDEKKMEAGERDVTNASTADVPTSINTTNIKDEMLIAETPGRASSISCLHHKK